MTIQTKHLGDSALSVGSIPLCLYLLSYFIQKISNELDVSTILAIYLKLKPTSRKRALIINRSHHGRARWALHLLKHMFNGVFRWVHLLDLLCEKLSEFVDDEHSDREHEDVQELLASLASFEKRSYAFPELLEEGGLRGIFDVGGGCRLNRVHILFAVCIKFYMIFFLALVFHKSAFKLLIPQEMAETTSYLHFNLLSWNVGGALR